MNQSDRDARRFARYLDLIASHPCKPRLLDVIGFMPANGFERLCMKLLERAGFQELARTGGAADRGIDAIGVCQRCWLKVKVGFQFKLSHGPIPAKWIRDFRYALQGRAMRGVFITTGRFTEEARIEAARLGLPPIELVDGPELVVRLTRHGLGEISAITSS